MRRLLWPLTLLYGAAVAAKSAAYDRGWLKTEQLEWPVISVGNLSVGGSGKTPLVIALSELVVQNGWNVDVLSRGYGRSSNDTERVDPEGSAERFGDEPLLIAQATTTAVYVGASRYAAGILAEKEQPGPRLHLLDDGFQHRRLFRNADIVVIHRSDFEEKLLPAGRLREPIQALKRASILVLREEDADLEPQLRRHDIEVPVWRMERSIDVPKDVGRAFVFCGIARPDEFFSSLRARGIEPAATHAFRDHHSYTDTDLQQLIRSARAHSADSFLTTEKDFVRLSKEQRAELTSIVPLTTARLVVRLHDEAAALHQLLAFLPAVANHSV